MALKKKIHGFFIGISWDFYEPAVGSLVKVNAKSWKTNYDMLKSTRGEKICIST